MSSIISRTRNEDLKFVDNLDDYKVHHDDVDIRDFDVKLSTGETIGEVEGLLADVSAELVRYVEIEVEEDVINRHISGKYTADDRHVLIPIGLVTINEADKTITVNGIGLEHMFDFPRYNRNNETGYTTSYELDVNNYLSGFHEFGPSYNRGLYDTPTYRSSSRFDRDFYASKFYANR